MPTTMVTTLPKPAPFFPSLSDLVNKDDLITLYLLDMITGPGEDEDAWNATWSPRPVTPERAPARSWTRQYLPSPSSLRPPLDLSLHPPAHLDVSNHLDIAIGPPVPCRR
jgi:hypothetical protein